MSDHETGTRDFGGGGAAKLQKTLQRKVANVGARLTDRTRQKIIADRVEGMSIRRLAKKYNVSEWAVRTAIKSDPTVTQKITEKKEQNTQDMLAFLDANKQSAQEFILMAMEALKDPEKLSKTGAQSIAVAMGIIIDKFMPVEKKDTNEGVEIVWGRHE